MPSYRFPHGGGARRTQPRDPNRGEAATGRALAKTSQHSLKRIEQRLTVIPDRQVRGGTVSELQFLLPSGLKKAQLLHLYLVLVCVVLPVALASIYYAFIASNQYVAEFRFTVTDTVMRFDPPTSAGILSLLGGGGGGTSNQNYIVTDFITSRQAVEELQHRIHVINLYSKPSIDWWSRFSKKQPDRGVCELLAKHGHGPI